MFYKLSTRLGQSICLAILLSIVSQGFIFYPVAFNKFGTAPEYSYIPKNELAISISNSGGSNPFYKTIWNIKQINNFSKIQAKTLDSKSRNPENLIRCNSFKSQSLNTSNTEITSNMETSPEISIEVELLNCKAWEDCNANPQVKFAIKGENHRTEAGPLFIQIGSDKTTCKNQLCILDMPVTNEKGMEVKYWTESTTGKVLLSSSFKMRNRIIGGDGTTHYFEVMGDGFLYPIDVCANIWDIFPEENELKSAWLQRADEADDLYTEVDYAMLAGQLIWYGYVDASACQDGGLLTNRAASECGIEKARAQVIEWQNQHNSEIIESSNETDIPSRLLKGLVGQESQFWPDWQIANEYGYGMITELGTDLLLTWNVDYYLNLCDIYYPSYQCMSGYSSLSDEQQQFLRGICLSSAGSEKEFLLLANTLKAGCSQTMQLIENITGEKPEDVFSYQDLWRINLGVYNTGAGCMGEAITDAWDAHERAMTWEEFIEYIPAECESAGSYFDKVINYGTIKLKQSTK